jgi:hypothetical protein
MCIDFIISAIHTQMVLTYQNSTKNKIQRLETDVAGLAEFGAVVAIHQFSHFSPVVV